MKIAVTTPTGNVGHLLAPMLVRAGITPLLLLRDASKLPTDLAAASQIVELDQGDVEAVIAATAGVEALYWVDPPTDDDDPIEGYERMGRCAASAIRANGIPRVVFQSSGGAEARHGFGEIDGLGRTEELLNETGCAVTHLRCGYFFSNLLMNVESIQSGVIPTTLPIDQRIPWVAPADIASVASGLLLSNEWSGQRSQGVHGPADLSFADVAAILSETLDIEVRPEQISDAEAAAPLRSLGMTEAQIDAIVGMSRGLRGIFSPENQRDILSTTPTTLSSWVHDHLRQLVRPNPGKPTDNEDSAGT